MTGTQRRLSPAIQMDMKVHGLPAVEILKQLSKSQLQAASSSLDHMLRNSAQPRTAISEYAPRIERLKSTQIRSVPVIGKGGETINKITGETGAQIDIAEDGLITVAASDTAKN